MRSLNLVGDLITFGETGFTKHPYHRYQPTIADFNEILEASNDNHYELFILAFTHGFMQGKRAVAEEIKKRI